MQNIFLNKFKEFTFYFFSFAIFGWLMETIFSFIVLGHFTARGFLYGPLCPIYGFGALILILFLGRYKKSPLKLFLYSVIIFSIFEYAVSYIMEVIFNAYFWDYTNDFLNLNGRIAIFYSLSWGFIALIFIGFVYPLIEKFHNKIINKIPYSIENFFLIVIFSIFIIDIILSCIKYLS